MATRDYIELEEFHSNGAPDTEEVNDGEEDAEDDSFLYYSMANEEEEAQRYNTADRGPLSGWQSKNDTSRIAKVISKNLVQMKITKERLSQSNLRESSSSVRLYEEDLIRAAEISSEDEQYYCSCLPNKLNHVYMCVLLFFALFVLGGGLLVMGLLSDFESLNATPYETRLITVPNTRWYDCLTWRRYAVRESTVEKYSRTKSISPVGEAEFYLFDSPPKYTSQPHVTTQTREVIIGTGDVALHYIQFYINGGGQVNFAWSFRPENNTGPLAPIDVLWVKGRTEFQSLAEAGAEQDSEPVLNNRISSSHFDRYSSVIQDSDDYYLVFRHKKKDLPGLTGVVNAVVSTPMYDLSTAVDKLATIGELCFPFSTPAYIVLSIAHPGADDVLYVVYRFSKRYDFTMSVTGGIAGLIFIPLILFWIVMAIREWYWNRKRRLSASQDEENPQESNQSLSFAAPPEPVAAPPPTPPQQHLINLQPPQPQPPQPQPPQPADQLQPQPSPRTNEEDWW